MCLLFSYSSWCKDVLAIKHGDERTPSFAHMFEFECLFVATDQSK